MASFQIQLSIIMLAIGFTIVIMVESQPTKELFKENDLLLEQLRVLNEKIKSISDRLPLERNQEHIIRLGNKYTEYLNQKEEIVSRLRQVRNEIAAANGQSGEKFDDATLNGEGYDSSK